ncbi:DDE-type integrase/transposase/recombinase [Salipiger aestuarii]
MARRRQSGQLPVWPIASLANCQFGRLIDFRLTARRNARAARAFLRQAQETVHLYRPLTIVTEAA